ncbi:MAG: type II CRISPR RNA-guided endonuclease Cas9 [Geminicoccaceae bacterium]|nr:MAG: type II CRISPR RNA-guided endonuclease Cas9 [Geminicoccaceae bacterium]
MDVELVFGFDIGATSIGFAVIEYDASAGHGRILRLGSRIFPEARDPDGQPWNQTRRQKRMMRRQLRRRRQRRRDLNELLNIAGLLPAFGSEAWDAVMQRDPYELRQRGVAEALSAFELGRALYHLAQRRHFRGRELVEQEPTETDAVDAEEKEAANKREADRAELKQSGLSLGAWLHSLPAGERRRHKHLLRNDVRAEFELLVAAQWTHHARLGEPTFQGALSDAIFHQRPVFWRKKTLGQCRFVPEGELCPKGSWLSHQRRMLEKVNNLSLIGGNARPLDDDERAAILAQLQTKPSLSWTAVRKVLAPLFRARGEAGGEKSLRFNLQVGGEPKLLGNPLEAKLAGVFGDEWAGHPHKQAIRDTIHGRLWSADYGEIGTQRVVIRSEAERSARRQAVKAALVQDFALTDAEAQALAELTLPAGWEPYSVEALRAFLPELEAGARFGALVGGPEFEDWRLRTFPNAERPTGELFDELPSPRDPDEARRLAGIRNPTVVRVQNELRKVVNNLIRLYGKPDRIRIEVARDVGLSKREREDKQAGMRRNEKRRDEARKDLVKNGIAEPSRDEINKWLLWKEGRDRCPYSGDYIGFHDLFGEGNYEVEHIWPRSRSFDDGLRNKTLCRRDWNLRKSNKTPFELFAGDADGWQAFKDRLEGLTAKSKGAAGLPPGKVKRMLAPSLDEDFTQRQLVDTGYAARQALAMLKRLWPDVGPTAPVKVEPVTGKVTAHLRRLWGLNNVLADDGEKTRADHRHHAVDALTVACTHPGMTNRLARYFQQKDDPRAQSPALPPPWPGIRADAERAVAEIVVSHRVRKKVSGPLHKETVYGDTGQEEVRRGVTYRTLVTRKPVDSLSKAMLDQIVDPHVREVVKAWVAQRGGEPKKAFPPYPRVSEHGPEIRKVRVHVTQQLALMAPVGNGYADLGDNHHIALFKTRDGKAAAEVVSLFEAARRLGSREPVIRRAGDPDRRFWMSLAPGDAVRFSKGERKGIWIVQGVWANTQVVLVRHDDALGTTTTRPRPAAFLKDEAEKVSIDPIGRIRPGND